MQKHFLKKKDDNKVKEFVDIFLSNLSGDFKNIFKGIC